VQLCQGHTISPQISMNLLGVNSESKSVKFCNSMDYLIHRTWVHHLTAALPCLLVSCNSAAGGRRLHTATITERSSTLTDYIPCRHQQLTHGWCILPSSTPWQHNIHSLTICSTDNYQKGCARLQLQQFRSPTIFWKSSLAPAKFLPGEKNTEFIAVSQISLKKLANSDITKEALNCTACLYQLTALLTLLVSWGELFYDPKTSYAMQIWLRPRRDLSS